MTDTSPLADAHQAIGEYFCAFSRVEQQLGESVKVVFGLENNDASDAIVAALGDFARKASLVNAASKSAKNADGSEASAEWKARAETTIKNAFNYNMHDRIPLAHSLLQPNADGSVDLVRLKIDHDGNVTGRDAVKWSNDKFRTKIQQLDKPAAELKALNGELRTFKYTIPDLGWMNTDSSMPRTTPFALFMATQQGTPGQESFPGPPNTKR